MTDTPVNEPVKGGSLEKPNDPGCATATRIIRFGFRCSHRLAVPIHKQRLRQRKIWIWCYKHRRLLINKERSKQENVFLRAILRGEDHNVAILLARGMNPDMRGKSGVPALLYAVIARRMESVTLLLKAGADIEARSPLTGETALVIAAMNNAHEMIRLLLSYGFEVDACGISGGTPLLYAVYCGHLEAVELLLEHGASPYIKAKDGCNARWYAARSENAAIKALIEQYSTLDV